MVKMGTFRLGVALLTSVSAVYAALEPIILQGSEWLGDEGQWSVTEFWVGGSVPDDAKNYMLIGMGLSETWVVGNEGCIEFEQECPRKRGGIFNPDDSTSWHSLGDYTLKSAIPHLATEANAAYGLDTVLISDSVTHETVQLSQSVVGVVNSKTVFNGMFGLGITTSQFENQGVFSPFCMLVGDFGFIPSYTYGYTAGAHYRNGTGSHSSLVLGGYDENRFEPNDIEFSLQKNEGRLPQALVRGIEVSVPDDSDKPVSWDSRTQILSRMNESFIAIIDSSTPYLWLPGPAFDAFVDAMELTLSKALDASVMDNNQKAALEKDNLYSFTFTLSSFEYTDDWGSPLEMDGVLNITLPGHAFSQVLRYPYGDIEFGQDPEAFFPVKRAEGDKYILGRTFMQEAYIVTKYDSETFSLHQAKHPENANDINIKKVTQPSGSGYPPPNSRKGGAGALTKSQMIGIVCGTVVVCLVGLLTFCFCCHKRRKAKKTLMAFDDPKDAESSIMEEVPRTPVARIFSKILRRKHSRKSETDSVTAGTESNPAEVGADATHAVYELSAPIPAVELDADTSSVDADTELGTEATDGTEENRYMVAKRRIDRALAGPVPAYSPPENGAVIGEGSGEKSMQDISPVDTYRPADRGVSPTSSPTHTQATSNQSLPSPMSPHPDWATRMPDLPSPMTNVHPPFPFPNLNGGSGGSAGTSSGRLTLSSRGATSFDPSSISHSNSSNAEPSPTSATSMVPPSPVFQRTPIDPSRIICLGPLPENVQLPSPGNSTILRVLGPDGQPVALPGSPTSNRGPRGPTPPSPMSSNPASTAAVTGSNPAARVSTDTLGSNFTDMEERMEAEEMARQSPTRSNPSPNPLSSDGGSRQARRRDGPAGNDGHRLESPTSPERIDPGAELIHVPQLAERRYSWEEER